MTTDRGRRTVRSKRQAAAPASRSDGVQLASGVRLEAGDDALKEPVLVCASGVVQLNKGAVAILRLCDGSRGREHIVAEVVRRSRGRTLASDIGEFLDVAEARGWIVDRSLQARSGE